MQESEVNFALSSIRFGCALFSENRKSPGWASVAGGTAFAVTSPSDLSNDVLWWSNIKHEDMRGSNYSGYVKLKGAKYLRTDMSAIMGDIGIGPGLVSRDKAAEILSGLFDRVMTMSAKTFGLSSYAADSLSDEIRRALFRSETRLPSAYETLVEQSYQHITFCERNFSRSEDRVVSKQIQLRRNRIKHAEDILSTPIPGDEWEFVPESKLPPPGKRVDWVLNQPQPALSVVVGVKSKKADMSRLIAFGNGAKSPRRSITHPEMMLLSRFADIGIGSVLLAKEYRKPFDFPPSLRCGGAEYLSLGRGLLAENYWTALANQSYSPAAKKRFTTPRAAWLRSADRVNCFLPAMIMQSAGFDVSWYGTGVVAIENIPDFDAFEMAAEGAGLLIPLSAKIDVAPKHAFA